MCRIYIEGAVGGTGVDQDDLEVRSRQALVGDAVEERRQVLRLVVGSDNDAGSHISSV